MLQKIFVINLKHQMDKQKIGVGYLANKIGVSRNTITSILNNDNYGLKLKTVENIANALEIEVMDLLTKQDLYAGKEQNHERTT